MLVTFGGTRFACCRLNFVQLPTGHTNQQVFAIVPGVMFSSTNYFHCFSFNPGNQEILQILEYSTQNSAFLVTCFSTECI